MPRNGGGVYSLPATYEAITGQTATATQHNDPLEDLESDANLVRPIVAGGTGADTAVEAADAFSTQGADIASASTTNLATATGTFVHITGTTTITALGTAAAGVERTVVFSGALTLTQNATSLILPGAANIQTAVGDVAVFRSLGSGNWRCISYHPNSPGPQKWGFTLVTPGAVTSSTVTGVPVWATEIDIQINGLSVNGATPIILQLGDAGGIEATGYTNVVAITTAANTVAYAAATTLFRLTGGAAADAPNGLIQLRNLEGGHFQWNMTFMGSDGSKLYQSAGNKATSAALDRFLIGSENGTSTFDAGTFSYKWR